jgi:hypothetical protein
MNRSSFASLPRDLHDDAMRIIHRRSFPNFEAKLENLSLTYFTIKQATRCRRISSHRLHSLIGFEAQTDKPPPLGFEAQTKKPSRWFWGPNHQTVDLGSEAQTKKLSQWFWGQTTDKPSPPVLRLNRKTCASCLLHVYDADHTWHHLTSQSFSCWVPDLYLIIPDPPHQISYSCLDPRCCLPCHIHHLHITRQAITFLQTE